MSPLADKIRPTSLDEVVGQKHLLAQGMVLRNLVDSGNLTNLIFYGPSGVGKTTVARIIAKNTGKLLCKLNGTNAGTADLRSVVEKTDTIEGRKGVILYLDEIQYLNKKQQQTLLEFIEDGSITLIASTTENPYFYIYNAILSRSTIFEFKPVEADDILEALTRAIKVLEDENSQKIEIDDDALQFLSQSSGGDVRKAINGLELSWIAAPETNDIKYIDLDIVGQVAQRSNMRYDRDGDQHYDLLSAFHKSVRGSDENAAVHYLMRILEAGDIISISRRLLAISSEDVGLAYPQAVGMVKSCIDSAMQLGLPEAALPLTQATILLATAPKSNSVAVAMGLAKQDISSTDLGEVPSNLKDGHYSGAEKLGNAIGYKYPHDYENHYVEQQYLPDKLKNKVYYIAGNNKNEQAALNYQNKIKKQTKQD